jgi:hypothetical protein
MSAKSLLFRFCLAQPMDRGDRKYRDKMSAKLPHFTTQIVDHNNQERFVLTLPAHLDPDLRLVVLPDEYSREATLKKRENILALMACVRLHRNGLLSERLLPLTQHNIQQRVAEILTTCEVVTPLPSVAVNVTGTFYVLPISLVGGPRLEKARKLFKSHDLCLAVVSCVLPQNLPSCRYQHSQFGKITCHLENPTEKILPIEQVDLIAEFFAILMNARWKRRNDWSVFEPGTKHSVLVGAIDSSGSLDWESMKQLM